MMRILDLFCGRFGWGRAFAARGWEVVGIDLAEPPEIPEGCRFIKADIFELECIPDFGFFLGNLSLGDFAFVCASSPCEQFSVHGLKCFFKDPPYPELGIQLFKHTMALCEISGIPYAMENVRAAQQFVGNAVHHCGPFYLWGTGVPPIMPQGIKKPFRGASGSYMALCPPDVPRKEWRNRWQAEFERNAGSREACAAVAATIPPELSACVADYAERLLECAA